MVLALFLVTTAFAEEEEPVWGGGVEADTNYRYLWRGLRLSDQPVIQPSGWLWWGDGTLSLWASIPTPGDETAILELDPSVEWAFHAGDVNITPSVVGYVYPGDMGSSTAEGIVTVDVPIGPLSLYTSHAFDFLLVPGSWYGTVGLSVEQELPANLTVDGKLELAAADAAFNGQSYVLNRSITTVDSLTMGVGVAWAYGAFYVRPHGEFSAWLPKEAPVPLPYNVGLALGLDL